MLASTRTGHVIAGASLSSTLTVNAHVTLLLLASTALAVMDVVPTANVLPLAGVDDKSLTAQLSVAVGANETTAPQMPASLSTLKLFCE